MKFEFTFYDEYQTYMDGICNIRIFHNNELVLSLCGMASHFDKYDGQILIKNEIFKALVANYIICKAPHRFIGWVFSDNDNEKMTLTKPVFSKLNSIVQSLDRRDIVSGDPILFEKYKQKMQKISNADCKGVIDFS